MRIFCVTPEAQESLEIEIDVADTIFASKKKLRSLLLDKAASREGSAAPSFKFMQHRNYRILLDRIRRECAVSEARAAHLLEQYLLFMQMKCMSRDEMAEVISPPIVIDQIWHLHILDTLRYPTDCELLCGFFVHHDPDGAENVALKRRRAAETCRWFELFFGLGKAECRSEIWKFSDDVESTREPVVHEDYSKVETLCDFSCVDANRMCWVRRRDGLLLRNAVVIRDCSILDGDEIDVTIEPPEQC